MDELAGKRVYADRGGADQLVVAAPPGLVVVAVSDGRVGEFGVARRCAPADVAVPVDPTTDDGPRLAVATDEDVLLAPAPEVSALEPSGFGPAAAVTVDGDRTVAASASGQLAVNDGESWTTVAELSDAPTALEADLVGTTQGVSRLVDGALQPAGLDRVTDLARAAGIPLAATADGLYELGNGWLDVLAGGIQVVAGAPDGRAHAATADALFERVDGEWGPVDVPVDGPVNAVAYGERAYALTQHGDLLVEGSDGWGVHPLGLDGVRATDVL